jgi:hypothetical protein
MTDETPEPQVESTPPQPVDVDATWDGEGSLDDHRQQALKEITEPGFGREGAKPDDE